MVNFYAKEAEREDAEIRGNMTLEEVNDNEDISVSKTIEILDKSNHEIQETLEKVEKTRN